MKFFGISTLKKLRPNYQERNDPCASLDQTRVEWLHHKDCSGWRMGSGTHSVPNDHGLWWNGTLPSSWPDESAAKARALSLVGLGDQALLWESLQKSRQGLGAEPLHTPLGDICSTGYARPCRKVSSMSMSFSKVFSVVSSSPASLAFSSSKLRWNAVITGSSDFR